MIKNKEHGLLIVVSGPSGCGKSTVDNMLIEKRKNIVMSISDTTRSIRGQEQNGVDYNFITTEQFEENIKNDKYLEYAVVHSNKYYGTPVDFVDKNLKNGIDVILEIDIEGARKINEKPAVVNLGEAEDMRSQTTEICPECGHDKAYSEIKQTRSADEAPTRIFTCAKCKHVWRAYH